MSAPAGRGWGAVAGLVLAVIALSVVQPLPLVIVPLALLLLALPPRKPALLGLAALLAVLVFSSATADPFWYAERGWGLVLGAWFLAAVVFVPGGFLPRGLTAIAGTIGTAAAVFALSPGAGWRQVDWAMSRRLQGAATELAGLWGSGAIGGDGVAASVAAAIREAAQLQTLLYPAMLALASLAALAIAWWAYRRLTAGDARPLTPLREFRFRDELIWLVIAGLLLVLLPLGGGLMRTGSNLLAFMGVLYALRGAAVLIVLAGGVGLVGTIAAAVAAVLLYPLAVAATLVLGLSDTWLDLRARRRSTAGSGS